MNLLSLCAVVFLLKINYNNIFEKEKMSAMNGDKFRILTCNLDLSRFYQM